MGSIEDELLKSGCFYSENYDIRSFDFIGNHTQYIKDSSSERVCRFCGRKSPHVTFQKKAHAISRFLGNIVWILQNECDICNEQIFSPMEDDLAKYLQFSLNISGIRGRNGIPTIKDEATGFRMEHIQNGSMQIKCCQSDIKVDETKKTITISPNIKIQKYVPINVVKAFVKNICSVLDEKEFLKCKNTIQWLMSDKKIITQYPVLHTFIPGPKPFSSGKITVLVRKKRLPIPYIWGIFEFGNFRYQVMLPFCEEDDFWIHGNEQNTFNCFFYPTNTDYTYHKTYGVPVFYVKDMSSHEKITEACNAMSFSFSEIKSVPIETHESIQEKEATPNIAVDPLSLLPLYRLSATFSLMIAGVTKKYSNFIGSFSKEKMCFEITSYSIPIHFTISFDEKHAAKISVVTKDEVWYNIDVRKIQGIEFIKDFFYASKIICTIAVDGLQRHPLELPFPDQFLSEWKKTWATFMLYHDAVAFLNIPSTYNDFKEKISETDLNALRDFVIFTHEKNTELERISFSVLSDKTLSSSDDKKIEFIAIRSFMFNGKNIFFKVRFTLNGFKVSEEKEDCGKKSFLIESVTPVKAEFLEYFSQNNEQIKENVESDGC